MSHQFFGNTSPTPRTKSLRGIGESLLSPSGEFLQDDTAFKAGFKDQLGNQRNIGSILKNRALADQTRSFMEQRARGLERSSGKNLTDLLVTGDITGQGTAAIRKENRQGDLIDQGVGAALGRDGQPVDLNKASILNQAGGNKPFTLKGTGKFGSFDLGSGELKNPEIKDAQVAADVALTLKRVSDIGLVDAQSAKVILETARLADGKGAPATDTSKLNFAGKFIITMSDRDKGGRHKIIQFKSKEFPFGPTFNEATDAQRTLYVNGVINDILSGDQQTQVAAMKGAGVPDKEVGPSLDELKKHRQENPGFWRTMGELFGILEKHPANQLPQATADKGQARIDQQGGLGNALAIPGQAGPPGPTVTTPPSQGQQFFEGRQQQQGAPQFQGDPGAQPLDSAIAQQQGQVFDRRMLAQEVGQEVFVDEQGFAYVNIQGSRKFLGDEAGQKVRAR